MPAYQGRLELTWTNKDLRLLAHEDGSYEWVPPADYRVAEVRLLHNAGTVGDVAGDEDRAKDNLLIRGDALNALTSLIELPEFAREYVGKVKLVYLDPPFNTQQSFLHYDDALEHSVWLTMMRDRLLSIKTLLSPEGSVWVHCDDSEQAYLKVMMDEVFGRENFVATVIWQKSYQRENRADISTSHDYILLYASRAPSLVSDSKSPDRLQRSDETDIRTMITTREDHGKALPACTPKGATVRHRSSTIAMPSGRELDGPQRAMLAVTHRIGSTTLDQRIDWFGRDGNGRPRLSDSDQKFRQGLVPLLLWPPDEVGATGTSEKRNTRTISRRDAL